MVGTWLTQFLVLPEMDVKRHLNAEEESADKLAEKFREYEHFEHTKDEIEIKLLVFLLFTLLSFIFYIGDLSFDIYCLMAFHTQGNFWYFHYTLACLVIPAVVKILKSLLVCYYGWLKENEDIYDPRDFLPKESKCSLAMKWLLDFVCPIPRFWNIIRFAFKSKQVKVKKDDDSKNMYFLAMIWEDAELTQLRQFDCFMESAPQLFLCLYIVLKNGFYLGAQIDSVTSVIFPIFSVISVSLTLISYDLKMSLMKAIKSNEENRKTQSMNFTMDEVTNTVIHYIGNINLKTVTILFAANFLWIVSQIIPVILFAGLACWLALLSCFFHMIPTFAWYWCENDYSFIDSFKLSFLHIFAYLLPFEHESDRQKEPRFPPFTYLLICFFQNMFIMMLWSQSFFLIAKDGTPIHGLQSVWTLFFPCMVQLATMISSIILFWVVLKRNKCNYIDL